MQQCYAINNLNKKNIRLTFRSDVELSLSTLPRRVRVGYEIFTVAEGMDEQGAAKLERKIMVTNSLPSCYRTTVSLPASRPSRHVK